MTIDKDFVLRQTTFLHEADVAAVSERLKLALGADAEPVIDSALAQPDGNLSSAALAPIVLYAQQHHLDGASVGIALSAIRQEAAIVAGQGMRVFRGLLIYAAFLVLMMLAILVLFVTNVLPQFQLVYAGFGYDLPPLTAFVGSSLGGWILIGIPIAVMGFLLLLMSTGRRVLALRTRLHGWLFFVPIIRAPFITFRLWLRIMFVDALVQAGAPEASVVADTATLVPAAQTSVARHIAGCLEAACKIGTLANETHFWRESLESDLLAGFARARDVLGIAVQLTLGIVIAILVIAVYLPIFSLGATI